MTLPVIKKKQKQLLYYLYKFRFLTIQQLQILFNHKDPHRINIWLKDLKAKKYIDRIKYKDVTKPIEYCLAQRARHILKEDEDCDVVFLSRLYKEKDLQEIFRKHCLFIADIYLFFLSQKEKESELHFFTEHELKYFDYFPDEKPDAYIAVETNGEIDRYFLNLFDEYKSPAFVARAKIKQYLAYCEQGTWQEGTDNSEFPSILFVISNEKRKKHIYIYGRSVLKKSLEDISLYLTTKDMIKFAGSNVNIWQKVE